MKLTSLEIDNQYPDIIFHDNITCFVNLSEDNINNLLTTLTNQYIETNYIILMFPEKDLNIEEQYLIVPKYLEQNIKSQYLLFTNSPFIVSSIANQFINIYVQYSESKYLNLELFELKVFGGDVSFITNVLFRKTSRPPFISSLIHQMRNCIQISDYDSFDKLLKTIIDLGLTKLDDPELYTIIGLKNTKFRLQNENTN